MSFFFVCDYSVNQIVLPMCVWGSVIHVRTWNTHQWPHLHKEWFSLTQQLSTANISSVRGGVWKVPPPSLTKFWVASCCVSHVWIATSIVGSWECYLCHVQKTAFHSMLFHPLALQFFLLPCPCHYLHLDGQWWLIETSHLRQALTVTWSQHKSDFKN